MELTGNQLEFIEELQGQVQKFLVAKHSWREGNYKNYAFAREMEDLEADIKDLFKAIIREWLWTKGLTAYIRSELRVKCNYPGNTSCWVYLGHTSIYNDKGGLPDSKTRWLNKITVSLHRGKTRIVTHVVRTDADFLEPTATEFEALIQAIATALDR